MESYNGLLPDGVVLLKLILVAGNDFLEESVTFGVLGGIFELIFLFKFD